jgi:oxygen-dependent protoporphyrinogen oxidase
MTVPAAARLPRPADAPPAPRRPRIVVVGAGIAGLAAALRLVREERAADVAVYEAADRPGGVIATEHAAGAGGAYLIEHGPDSFLTEKPEALRLCAELGLGDRLAGVQPVGARTYVVYRGRLVAVPEGFRLVAPTRLQPWLRSPLFSWPGKLRMAMDWVLPARRDGADESVAEFVIRRFGREAFDRIAQPMIGTIYTGDAEALSLAATMPRLRDVERRYGSVIRGLARAHAAARAAMRSTGSGSGGGPAAVPGAAAADAGRRFGIFATPLDGMQALVDAAAARLPAGVLRLRASVTAIRKAAGGSGYAVLLADGTAVPADAVVLAVPAPAAARLLAGLDPALASDLQAIAYASSASVTLAYRREDIAHPLDGVGFVVPRTERRPILAASFASVKFPGRAPGGCALLRVFAGGALAPENALLPDDRLASLVRGEMEALLGARGTPQFTRVVRHMDVMPQYAVGHLDRVAGIDTKLTAHPGLALAGAAYRGIGIPDCIRSGEAAADAVLSAIGGAMTREMSAR